MRTAFPISVNFYDGEMPTGAKLRGLARQAKNGLSIVEYALGDLWNQGGDSFLSEGGTSTDNAVMIANLARYIGSPRLTSPRIPYLDVLNTYTHLFYVGDGFVGTQEAYLTFPPTGGSSYAWAGGATFDATPKATKGEVISGTHWYVNTTTGYCYFGSQLANGYKVTFTPDTTKVTDQDTTSHFNIIPSPYTNTGWSFRGCKIAYTNNTNNSQGYVIYFPPRGPLDWHVLDRGPQDSFLHGNSDNYDSTPDSATNLMFWQDPTVDAATNASTASHYRYQLPYALQNSVYFDVSATLPVGFVHLWDHYVTQTIITGITIALDSSAHTWAIVVSGSAMETWVTNNLKTCDYPADSLTKRDDHDPSYYPANGLRVITTGSSLSDLFSSMLQKFYNHDHGSGSSLVTKPISHNDLFNMFKYSSQYPFLPSKWQNDDHPQYLHRAGTSSIDTNTRDPYKNGMFYNMLLLSTDDTTYYQNLAADSMGIWFGQTILGPYLSYNVTHDALTLINKPLVIHTNIVGGVRLSNPYAGILTIEKTTAVEGSAEDGMIAATRYYTGPTFDNPWLPGWTTQGYNGADYTAGWGAVRKLIIPPEAFMYIGSVTLAGGQSARPSLDCITVSEVNHLRRDLGTTGFFQYNALGVSGAGNRNYLYAHINLPFAYYGIIDVMPALKMEAGFLTSSYYYIELGYYTYSGAPTYSLVATADLNTAFPTLSTSWEQTTCFTLAATSSPWIEVNNAADGVFRYGNTGRMPYVTFWSDNAEVGSDLFIGGVIVYYRIKEF